MEKEYKPFDPKSLGSEKILLLKLKDVEIEKDQNINDTNIEFEDYIVDFIFENIFGIDEFSNEIEQYFDKIYNTVLEESGLYIQNISIIDQNEIAAWGVINKKDDKYFIKKPDNFE